MDILHSGWLTKSPPLKKSYGLRLFKSHFQKWRRRYFVLYAPPVCDRLTHTPALLDYYSNEKMTQKKGTIDLSLCRSVHAKLRVEAHSNIFMLRIEGEKSRDFYLSAETEKELHEWILALQKVLGADMDAKTLSQPLHETSDLIPMEKLSLSPVSSKIFKTNSYVNQPKKTMPSTAPSNTTFYVRSQNNFQYTPRKTEMKLYHQQYLQQQSSWQQSNTQQPTTQQLDAEQQPKSPPKSSEFDDDSTSESLEKTIPDSSESYNTSQKNIFDTTPTTSAFQNNTPILVYDLPTAQLSSQALPLLSKPVSSSLLQTSSLLQPSSSFTESLTSSLPSSSLLSPPIPPKSIPDLNSAHYINSNIYDRPSNNNNYNNINNNINNNISNNNISKNNTNNEQSNTCVLEDDTASEDNNHDQRIGIPISQTNPHHISSAVLAPITSSVYVSNNNNDNNNSFINSSTSLMFEAVTNSPTGLENVYKLPNPVNNNNINNNARNNESCADDNDDYLSISHVYKVPKSELLEAGVDDVSFYINSFDVMNRRCNNTAANKYNDSNAVVNGVYNNNNNHYVNNNDNHNENSKINFYINYNSNNTPPKNTLKTSLPNDGYLDSHGYIKNPITSNNHDFKPSRHPYNQSHSNNFYPNDGHSNNYPAPENEYIFLSEVQSFDNVFNRLASIPLPTRINTGSSSSSSSDDDEDDEDDDEEKEEEDKKKTFSDFVRKDANHTSIHKSWSLNNENKVEEKKGFEAAVTSNNNSKSSNCILEPCEQVGSSSKSGSKSSNEKQSGINNSIGSCYDDDVFSPLERPEPPPKLHPKPQNLLPPKLVFPPLGNPYPDPHQACHTPIKYIDLDFVSNKPSQSPQDQITGKGLLGEELAQKKEMRGAEERSSSEGYHEIDIEKTQALSQIIAHRENQTEYSS